MTDEDYTTGSHCYLARAERMLNEGTKESLYYAARELRCGVEARLREYLDCQEHVPKKRRQEWNLGRLARTAKRTFSTENKVGRFSIADGETGELTVLYYTPVSRQLRKAAERLGNYLHASRQYHPPDDPFWKDLRGRLREIAAELRKATAGTLLGMPLMRPGNKLAMPFEYFEDESIRRRFKKGGQYQINVEYLDEYPSELLEALEASAQPHRRAGHQAGRSL